MQHPVYCTSPVPVAEMISSDHGTAEITHFLNKWDKDLRIDQIEMDYSWAIMHSTCLAFNKLSIALYLTKCWEIIHNKTSTKSTITTVLHLCSAHIMHRISYQLDKNYKIDKKVKRLVLHAFGTMVKSSNIEEIILVFESLCTLLTTELMSPQVTKSLIDLEGLVKGDVEMNSPQSYFLDGYPENIESDTYRKMSPFGRYFEELYHKTTTKISTQKLLANNKNLCYYPKILEYLLTYYLPLLPLWSGIILSRVKVNGISTDSNAEVENWFKIVKYSIFKSQINIRVGDFVRHIFAHIEDRLASFKFAFQPLGQRVFKGKKRTQEASNEQNCKEIWVRRKKNKNSYINPNTSQIDRVFSKLKGSNFQNCKTSINVTIPKNPTPKCSLTCLAYH